MSWNGKNGAVPLPTFRRMWFDHNDLKSIAKTNMAIIVTGIEFPRLWRLHFYRCDSVQTTAGEGPVGDCLAVSTRAFEVKNENIETFAIFVDNAEAGV